MALRNVRIKGDDILKKISKPVKEVNDRTRELIADMFETMEKEEGCGLAAVQIGILRRIFVVDSGQEGEKFAFINPEITYKSEEMIEGGEGCLSVPGKAATVPRPKTIKISALDENGNKVELEASDFLARIICHEYDHLDGILYIDKAIDKVMDSEKYWELHKPAEKEGD